MAVKTIPIYLDPSNVLLVTIQNKIAENYICLKLGTVAYDLVGGSFARVFFFVCVCPRQFSSKSEVTKSNLNRNMVPDLLTQSCSCRPNKIQRIW